MSCHIKKLRNTRVYSLKSGWCFCFAKLQKNQKNLCFNPLVPLASLATDQLFTLWRHIYHIWKRKENTIFFPPDFSIILPSVSFSPTLWGYVYVCKQPAASGIIRQAGLGFELRCRWSNVSNDNWASISCPYIIFKIPLQCSFMHAREIKSSHLIASCCHYSSWIITKSVSGNALELHSRGGHTSMWPRVEWITVCPVG